MKHKSWFTFIEVIIAITVFAIGVLAVLRLITQNLVTLDNTEARTTATFLAKEWIELVYNMRDSNNQKSLPWDCVLYTDLRTGDWNEIDAEKVCMRYFASWTEDNNVLQIAFAPEGYTYTALTEKWTGFNELREKNRLYYTTGEVAWTQLFRYSYAPVESDEPSIFSRYILFDVVRDGSKLLPPNKILKIESHVLYMKGAKTWDVVLESFIWNY